MDNTSQGSEQPITSSPEPSESSQDGHLEYTASSSEPEVATESFHEESDSTHSSESNDPEWIQKRLGRQARKHRQEKEELSRYYEKMLQEARYQNNPQMTSQLSSPEDIDFNNPQHVIAAMDELVNQRFVEEKNRIRQKEMRMKLKKVSEEARKKYPDLDYLAEQYDNGSIPPDFDKALVRCDNAHDVLYQVLKNPKEYENLLSMDDPADVISRMKELSVRLALNSKNNAVSKVDSPIKPLGHGGLSVNHDKSVSDMRADLRKKEQSRRRR